VDEAPGGTEALLTLVATSPRHELAAEPRHAAELLREELDRMDDGDDEGARAVLQGLLVALAS
jgi:hypothetical protein